MGFQQGSATITFLAFKWNVMMIRLAMFLMASLLSSGSIAEQCRLNFVESDLITAIGVKPKSVETIKDDGAVKKQYKFRNELSTDELLSDDADEKYEPQFYLTISEPSCSKEVKIWFYKDNKNTVSLTNEVLASRAFKYLTGVNESIFENKFNKFSSVNSFESFDGKTHSRFLKSGDIYSVDVLYNE